MRPIDPKRLVERKPEESTAMIAARVMKARDIQKKRFAEDGIFSNAAMNSRLIEKYCPLDKSCKLLLEKIIGNLGLSARACHRIIKLARTIADLEGSEHIRTEHISEAAGYRFLDKQTVL